MTPTLADIGMPKSVHLGDRVKLLAFAKFGIKKRSEYWPSAFEKSDGWFVTVHNGRAAVLTGGGVPRLMKQIKSDKKYFNFYGEVEYPTTLVTFLEHELRDVVKELVNQMPTHQKHTQYLHFNNSEEVIDATLDKLHAQNRLKWTDESTPFSFPCFVVWKWVNGTREGRVVVDIRALNHIMMPDAYPTPSPQ